MAYVNKKGQTHLSLSFLLLMKLLTPFDEIHSIVFVGVDILVAASLEHFANNFGFGQAVFCHNFTFAVNVVYCVPGNVVHNDKATAIFKSTVHFTQELFLTSVQVGEEV